MNEQLIAPILERISLGYGKEDIKKEVLGFGYGETDFEAAYNIAMARSGKDAQAAPQEAPVTETESEAVVENNVAAQEQRPETGEKKSNKSMILILIGLIVVIIGISGVVLAYNTGMFTGDTGNEAIPQESDVEVSENIIKPNVTDSFTNKESNNTTLLRPGTKISESTNAPKAVVSSTLDDFSSIANVYYLQANDESYSGFCTTAMIVGTMLEIGVESSAYSCLDSQSAYIINVRLEGDEFVCADSTDFVGEISESREGLYVCTEEV